MQKILISQCLIGEKVRYDGKDNLCQHPLIQQWLQEQRLISVCPEVAAGMSIPRLPAEIIGIGGGEAVLRNFARIQENEGKDVSKPYIYGAEVALNIALKNHIKIAILKEGSPSCGSSEIYNGHFNNQKIPGMGVTAALLRNHGIKVFNEHQIDLVKQYLLTL